VKNLETALTCRKYGKEVAPEIIGDNVFSKALRTSNSKDFGLGMEFPYAEKVISLMGNTNLIFQMFPFKIRYKSIEVNR